MYQTEFAKSFLKDMKKIPKEVQNEFFDKWVPKIQENPYIGQKFKGKILSKFTKLAFRYKRNDYRVVYQIRRQEILVIMLAIGSRENFYKKFEKRFR